MSQFVADPPVLDITGVGDGNVQVVLYGKPDQTYLLKSGIGLAAPSSWPTFATVAMTNSFRILPVSTSPEPTRFFRGEMEP